LGQFWSGRSIPLSGAATASEPVAWASVAPMSMRARS
jgi:hypothetical protein